MLCEKQQQLIGAVCAASTHYYDATTRLVALAGRSLATDFADAKLDCKARQNDCDRAKTALHKHKADHGC